MSGRTVIVLAALGGLALVVGLALGSGAAALAAGQRLELAASLPAAAQRAGPAAALAAGTAQAPSSSPSPQSSPGLSGSPDVGQSPVPGGLPEVGGSTASGGWTAALPGVAPGASGPWPSLPLDQEALFEEQARALGLDQVEGVLRQATEEWRAYLPDLSLRAMADRLRQGKFPLDIKGLAQGLSRYGLREAVAGLRLLGQLLALALICALLAALEAAMSRAGVGRLAYSVCYLAMISLALGGLLVALGVARAALEGMVSFMLALLPLLATLLVTVGAPITAGLFSPLMVVTVHTVAVGAAGVAFPLLVFSVALDAVGHLSPEHRLSGLAVLFRQGALFGLGLMLCLFLGAAVVLGAAGAVADGVALRTAKFVSSTFVPVVGKMFSDAAELVFSSSLLLKGAVGLAGAVAVAALAVFPLVKLFSLVVVFRLGAALAQPVAGAGVAASLESMGAATTLALLVLSGVALMFFLALVMVLGAGSAAVMLR